MPSEVRSPRTLSSWLELDYHRRRRLFAGWWLWLLGGAILAGLSLAGLYAAAGNKAFQAGPVTRPHALFNHDCGQCHEGNFTTLTRLWRGDAVGSVPNKACERCHEGSAHNHPHAGAVGRCVECHKEHRGHDALVRVSDSECVQCHRDLRRADGTEPKFTRRVLAFNAREHPEISTPGDPGTIRFNHAVHLREKGVEEWAGGPRKRLDCANCHVADERGRYMAPISFEQHCKECHPLGAQVVGQFADPGQRQLLTEFSRQRVEHPRKGQTAQLVRSSLRSALTAFILDPKHKAFLSGEAPPPRPLPDRGETTVPEQAFAWVNRQVMEIERVVFDGAGGCRYCHQVSPRQGDALPAIAPPGVPDRWWKHARFSHASHRALDCAGCHDVRKSKETSDVLLPDIQTCLKCHDTRAAHSARSGCVDCHDFHNPVKQRATRSLSIDQLRGFRR